MNNWKKAWALLNPDERRRAVVVLVVAVVSGLVSAVMVGSILPFLSVVTDPSRIESVPALAWAYERFGFSSTYSFVVALGLASIAIIVVTTGIQVLRVYVTSRFVAMGMHTIAHDLLHGYLRQSYPFFVNRHSGSLGTQILSESQLLVNQFFRPASNVVAAIFSIAAIVVLLIVVDPLITFASLGVLGTLFGSALLMSRRALARASKERLAANEDRHKIVGEIFGGIKDIKLAARERDSLRSFEKPSLKMARAHVTSILFGELPSQFLQGLTFVGFLILVLIIVEPADVQSGRAMNDLIPVLGVFAFAAQRMIPEFQRLHHGLSTMRFGVATLDAVYKDHQSSRSSNPLPEPLVPAMGLQESIVFDNVSYTYPSDATKGIFEVNLEVKAGERIGLVGTSGAGKSTMADLLLGLITPVQGTIRVDGTALDADTLRAWQQTVGYVPQSIFLADATIRENIALGLPEDQFDIDRVKEACRIAQLDRFIEDELPDGYDTQVGERGVRLSGGQRQRIGIARALYRQAEVIVLDEATSALDNQTEASVMDAINALPHDITVLIIAHRLTTLRDCARIAVFERGRVVGLGPWDQLMAENDEFQRIATIRNAE